MAKANKLAVVGSLGIRDEWQWLAGKCEGNTGLEFKGG